MKFFSDSKPPKTEDEKYHEWFEKCLSWPPSKHFVVLWASLTSNNDIKYIDRMTDEGYVLIGLEARALESTLLIFKKPKTNEDTQ